MKKTKHNRKKIQKEELGIVQTLKNSLKKMWSKL
jgi:hypothetical protein